MIGLENSSHPLNQSEATNRVLITRTVMLSESILIGSLYIPFWLSVVIRQNFRCDAQLVIYKA